MNPTKVLHLRRPNWSYIVDKFLSFHCLPRPPFGCDQHFPIPFNCQQIPLFHVAVSDVLKVTGKQNGQISLRWCGQTFPRHNLCRGKFIHHENLVFTLCECLFAKNKWCTLIHKFSINVWKPFVHKILQYFALFCFVKREAFLYGSCWASRRW